MGILASENGGSQFAKVLAWFTPTPTPHTKVCANMCGRDRAEGFSACCGTCTRTNGAEHGPKCEKRYQAAGLPRVACGPTLAYTVAASLGSRRVCVNGCGREPADGFAACCGTCTRTEAHAHGPKCEARQKIVGPPSASTGVTLVSKSKSLVCINGSGRGRADGYLACCGTCTRTNAKEHGPKCEER